MAKKRRRQRLRVLWADWLAVCLTEETAPREGKGWWLWWWWWRNYAASSSRNWIDPPHDGGWPGVLGVAAVGWHSEARRRHATVSGGLRYG